ncbi:MAG: MFS transporter [Clostridia bacterium]|nr:MFS transporter [Clostridia bacterium]
MVKKLWNKNFILLLQGSAVSMIGDLMYSVAIGYWVYEKTGSNSLMGIMSSISMFVTMLLSPFSGTVVDKINRKWILVLGDFLQGILMLTIGILAFSDKLSVPIVLVAAFLAALGGVFYSPASNTVLIDVVPRDDLVRGQSLFSGVSSTINMIGTAFSGAMVAFLGVPIIIIINGCSNIYSAISELLISIPKTPRQGEKVSLSGILIDFKIAVKTIFENPCLRVFIPCAVLLNFLASGPFTLMLPFTIEKGLAVEQYGILMSMNTVGSLIGVIMLGTVKFSSRSRYWILALGFSSSVVFWILAYQSSSFIPMCLWMLLGSFGNSAGNTVFGASMMLALPEDNRGAILGFFSAATTGGIALSALAYGFLGDVFPLFIVFTVGSLLSLAPMLYLCFNPQIKSFILEN